MFISFTNRISSFFPKESENSVKPFSVWCTTVCFFWGWRGSVLLLFVEKCVWNGEPTWSAQDIPVYITKLKCNMCRQAGLTVKCLSGFHLPGWQESSPQSPRFRRAATGPVYQLVSEQLRIIQKKIFKLMSDKMHILPPVVIHTFVHILMSCASSVGQVLYLHCSHSIWTCYEWICAILHQMLGRSNRKYVLNFL